MDKRMRGLFALAGLSMVTACGSPNPPPFSGPSTQHVLAQPQSPSVMPPAPDVTSQPQPPTLSLKNPIGFRIQDQRTYFHQHTAMWVWLPGAQRYVAYNTPENWNGTYGNVYTTMGFGNYAWWNIPFNYQGWVWYWAGNRWQAFYGGYFGNRPIIQQ